MTAKERAGWAVANATKKYEENPGAWKGYSGYLQEEIETTIRQALADEREACCAAICNLCGSDEFPLAEDAPGWHRCAVKGKEDFPRQKCAAVAIRSRGPQ